MAKAPADLRSLARGHTEMCVRVLASIAKQPRSPPAARAMACGILLDRGWGKAVQPHVGDDEKPIALTIRKIITGDDK